MIFNNIPEHLDQNTMQSATQAIFNQKEYLKLTNPWSLAELHFSEQDYELTKKWIGSLS